MKTLVRAALVAMFVLLAVAGPNDPRFRDVAASEREQNAPEEVERVAHALPEVRRITAADSLGTGVFEIVLEATPDAISRAFLVYELAGVPHWTATVRSINGLPAAGGFGA